MSLVQLCRCPRLILPSAVGFLNSPLALGFPGFQYRWCLGAKEPSCTSKISVLASPKVALGISRVGNRFRHASVDDDNRELDNNGFLWGFLPFLGTPQLAQSIPDCPGGGADTGTCPTSHRVGSQRA